MLFTSIMARRLEKFLPSLIHNDQTVFIRECLIEDHVPIINHILKNRTEATVISINAEKALDSVSWSFFFFFFKYSLV